MSDTEKKPTPEQLRQFAPFVNFDHEGLVRVSENIEIHSVPPRKKLIELGSTDKPEIFLLEGKLGLEARDGKKSIISSSSESAKLPISRARWTIVRMLSVSNGFRM